MKIGNIAFLFFLLVIAQSWSNNCPSFNAGDLLQSGKSSFYRGSTNNPEYTFDAPIAYQVPNTGFQLAVSTFLNNSGTSTIADYNSNQGFSFQVSGQRKDSTNFIQFKLIVSLNTWSSIQVSWFASSRSDFSVGNAQFPVNQWNRANSDTFSVSQQINKYLPSANYKVAAFISGFSTSDPQFKVSINQKSFNTNTRTLTISFYCTSSAQPISITLSYIIYPQTHQTFQLSYQTTPQGQSGAYQITGPISLQNGNIQYNQFRIANRFLVCNGGNQCQNTCILREDCLQLNGNSYEGQCYFCAQGIVFEYGQCTRRCGQNQVYTNRVCVCLNGYVRRGNACIKDGPTPITCNQNQILYNNQCRQCPSNSYAQPQQSTCVCQNNNQIYNITSNTCTNVGVTCGQNQYNNNNGRCVCINGYGRYNNICRQCPYQYSNGNQECVCQNGQNYNPNTNQCVTINNCGVNQVYSNGQCVCVNNYIRSSSGDCVQCPSNSVVNVQQNTCVCQNGLTYNPNTNQCINVCGVNQVFSNGQCVCLNNYIRSSTGDCIQCPSNSVVNLQQNVCVCQNGLTYNSNTNQCINVCGNNQVYSNGQCVCVNNYIRLNNDCVQCPSNSVPNVQQNTCICQSGLTYNSNSNSCINVCGINQVYTNNGCVCINNYIRSPSGDCRQCPSSSVVNIQQNTCICQNGLTYNPNTNQCDSICPSGQYYNNGVCVCPPSSIKVGTSCVQCPVLSTPNVQQSVCVCQNGYTYNANSNSCIQVCGVNQVYTNNGCVCVNNYIRSSSGECVQCPSSSVPNVQQNVCVCQNGLTYNPNTNQCINVCGNNQVYSNGQCVCVSNYIRYNNDCRQCPSNSVPNVQQNTCICQSGLTYNSNSNQCVVVCGNNQVFSNGQCVCVNNYIRSSTGDCIQCPSSSTPNVQQNVCVCQNGLTYNSNTNQCINVCGVNQVYSNGQCVCANGYVRYTTNGDCRACPNNAVPNQQQNTCVCQNGLSFNFTINQCVVVCGNNQVLNNNGQCTCINNYIRSVTGDCIQCPSSSVPNVQQNTCVCQNGFNYNPTLNQCVSVCGPNQVLNNSQCVCINNYIRYNNVCQQCPSGSSTNGPRTACVCKNGYTYNITSNQCVQPVCGANQVFSNNQCVCINNYIRYNNVCRQCPSGSLTTNNNICICPLPSQYYDISTNTCKYNITCTQPNQIYSSVNNTCICVTNSISINNNCILCPSGSRVQNNQCVCPDGFTYSINSNSCVSVCQNGAQVWNGTSCVCASGYILYNNNQCRQCPKSSSPSPTTSTCLCLSQNAIYISNSNLCLQCASGSKPNVNKSACECIAGYYQVNGVCQPIQVIQCGLNQQLVNNTQCQCKYGYIKLATTCVQACGINQYFTDGKCYCKQGHARLTGVCRPCVTGSVANSNKTSCTCTSPRQYFIKQNNICVDCPIYSYPTSDNLQCTCQLGYTKINNICTSTCPVSSSPDSITGVCICSGNKIYNPNTNTCITPIACPQRSVFNTTTSTCVCTIKGENLINGLCKSCGENAIFNKDQCVCQTGYFNIAGACTSCDPRTKYNGTDCVCQLGYFGNRQLCTACDKSCSQCSGPAANQCLACSDVSLVLQSGYCSKNSPCDPGFFQQKGQCTKCLDNCIDCENIFVCKTCALGYQTLTQTVQTQTVTSCNQICGDGIKYQQQCDDGNLINGDGCNNKCQQEPGWYCSGGSSNAPSICKKYIPDTVQLSSKGAVNLGGEVIVSVRASYLPECVTKSQCARCFKVIKANVVNANVPILVTVNYVPASQYQFYVKFDFQGLYVSSIFKVVITLNDQFKGCIAEDDFNNQLEITVDPAFLAKVDPSEQLSLDDISGGAGIKIPQAALRNLGN